MENRVTMALDNATTTKALQLGCGVISTVGDVFAQQFAGRKAIIVADKTTWHVAGAKVAEILARDGIATCEPYIFDEPEMHAEWKYIDRLDAVLAQTDAVAIAVGSGTINDTTKLCSAHQQRPYMVVATAASMDGYVASGASITKDGKKQTFACPAPQAVVADVDIIAGAPEAMTASGYGDLFAKVPAGADWIVADVIGNEKIDPLSWSIVQDGLHSALADPEGARRGDKHAIEQLIEGLLLGGFAMQAYPKTSRPASGAEHQVSHMLNMANFTMANGNMPSHGFQVSMGVLVSLSLYEYLLEMDIEHLDMALARRAGGPHAQHLCWLGSGRLLRGRDTRQVCKPRPTAPGADRHPRQLEHTARAAAAAAGIGGRGQAPSADGGRPHRARRYRHQPQLSQGNHLQVAVYTPPLHHHGCRRKAQPL